MKVVILAGGRGSRISEETNIIPKPLIEINGKPIIIYLIEHYSKFGFNEFIISTGYLSNRIKEYFINFKNYNSDIEVDLSKNKINLLKDKNLNWKIKIVDTGLDTNTGGRIYKLKKYLYNEEHFLATYGDGLSDIDIKKLIKNHKKSKKLATVSLVKNQSRFGHFQFNKGKLIKFSEKPILSNTRINGGFFVFSKNIFKYLKNNSVLESEPIKKLLIDNQLNNYNHNGFWYAVDTLKDKIELEKLPIMKKL